MKIFLLFKQIAKKETHKTICWTETTVEKEYIDIFCDFLEAKKAVHKDVMQSHLIDENIDNKCLDFLKDSEMHSMHYIYNKAAITYIITEKEIINNKIVEKLIQGMQQ